MIPRAKLSTTLRKKKKYSRPASPADTAHRKNRLVEFWNEQSGVRQHRPGTKVYRQAAQYLKLLEQGQLFHHGILDEVWLARNNIPRSLILKTWDKQELQRALAKLARQEALSCPASQRPSLPWLLLDDYGSSKFLLVQAHGLKITRRPKLPTPDRFMSQIIDQVMDFTGAQDRDRCQLVLERLWDRYEREIKKPYGLNASLPWGTFWLFMLQPENGMLSWLKSHYRGVDIHLGWFKAASKPVDKFIAFVQSRLGEEAGIGMVH